MRVARSNSEPTPVAAQSAVETGHGNGPATAAASGLQRLVIEAWLPESLANGSHGHWSTRQRKLDRAGLKVWYYGKAYLLRPITGRAKVTITLVFPQIRRRDTDNLYARVKGVVDGLVKGGWIEDDSTEHLELIVRAEVRPGVKATELLLEPIQ